jgi:hypothetical protein
MVLFYCFSPIQAVAVLCVLLEILEMRKTVHLGWVIKASRIPPTPSPLTGE